MATKNHPKRQHSVPQCVLRNFMDGKERLAVFDKTTGKTFRTSPAGIAGEGGFYDFVDSKGDPQSAEYFLGALEGKAARVIGGVLDRQSIAHLTKDDRVTLSLFAAVQQLRVLAERERMRSLNAGIMRVLAERGIDGGDVMREVTEEEIKGHTTRELRRAKTTAEYFFNKVWILRQSPEDKPFWVSDNPITLHNVMEPNGRGLNSPGVEILFPISRRFSICFMCDHVWRMIQEGVADLQRYERDFGHAYPGAAGILHQAEVIENGTPDLLAPENVDHQNSLQVQSASRFVISPTDNFDLAREMIRLHPGLKEPPGYVVS